jgi:GLPGLI family protein
MAQQSHNFYYSLTFQLDSTNINSEKTDFFLLNIQNDKSVFASINTIRNDTMDVKIFEEAKKNDFQKIDFSKSPLSYYKYYITKENTNIAKEIAYYDKLGSIKYFYSENTIFDWKLTNEIKIIQGFSCQKATVKIYGRNFTAWFTKEIPFSEGPYSFYGLPGLIVDIQDEKNYYHFSLVKFDSKENRIFNIPENRKSNLIKTTKAKFLTAKKSEYQQIINRLVSKDVQLKKESIQRVLEKQKRINNFLERN